MADVEGVVERDLVAICHDLVQGCVVERGGEVAQERGQTLRGVEDVAIRPKHENESVNGLQHKVGELLSRQKLWLPVCLYFISL